MNKQLSETEFTVVDHIAMNPKWSSRYAVFDDIQDGTLMILEPPFLVSGHELTGIRAIAITPAGETTELRFDMWKINESGCIGLFFEGASGEIVPSGSKVVFTPAEQAGSSDGG